MRCAECEREHAARAKAATRDLVGVSEELVSFLGVMGALGLSTILFVTATWGARGFLYSTGATVAAVGSARVLSAFETAARRRRVLASLRAEFLAERARGA